MLTARWADDLVRRADEIEPHRKEKALFYLRQVTAALSPSNFVGTNPELLRATFEESGENIVRGLKMMAEDVEAGKGSLRIRQADAKAFKLGVNLATTPGKVVFRNDLMELIQYTPTTPEVYRRPLLIVPPWINKFYILDLNPEKSFIRWAVSQGLTVFVVSWVNPDERMADKGFEAYMREGILAALDAVQEATGERDIAAIGYCVGGTLLAATLGYMAAMGDRRITSATFFTTQIDFTDAGDLKVFVDAEQLKSLEERMAERGYLEGSQMANAFNMLRPNDLIWSYYVNNYLKGKDPMPFDLLVWNSDSTRMPAANHKFYLRHCYFQNDLSQGRMELGGVRLDLEQGDDPGLRACDKGGSHRAGALGLHRREELRRTGALRHGGLGPYRGRGEPAEQAEVPVLERRPAARRIRGLGREGEGNAGLMVARLDRLDQRAGAGEGPCSRTRRRQAQAPRRRAGRLCAGEVVGAVPRLS